MRDGFHDGLKTGAMLEPRSKPLPPSGPQFSLMVDQQGRATLRLNLLEMPMAVAMRAMAALTVAGLLPAGEAE
jgi:hypothetical protein